MRVCVLGAGIVGLATAYSYIPSLTARLVVRYGSAHSACQHDGVEDFKVTQAHRLISTFKCWI